MCAGCQTGTVVLSSQTVQISDTDHGKQAAQQRVYAATVQHLAIVAVGEDGHIGGPDAAVLQVIGVRHCVEVQREVLGLHARIGTRTLAFHGHVLGHGDEHGGVEHVGAAREVARAVLAERKKALDKQEVGRTGACPPLRNFAQESGPVDGRGGVGVIFFSRMQSTALDASARVAAGRGARLPVLKKSSMLMQYDE